MFEGKNHSAAEGTLEAGDEFSSGELVICRSCGARNPAEGTVCEGCGRPLSASVDGTYEEA